MEQPDTLVLVTRRGMGHADESLQEHVFGVWLKLTLENGTLPGAIAFYTDGVRLACEGSPVLEELEALEATSLDGSPAALAAVAARAREVARACRTLHARALARLEPLDG